LSLRDLLTRLQTAILQNPGRVLTASALLVLLAVALAIGVEFRTSRSELAPPGDPDQARWDALLEDYSGSEAVFACIEAVPRGSRDAAEMRTFTDALSRRFATDVRVDHVYHRFDLDWLSLHGLYLAPPESLDRLAALDGEGAMLRELSSVRGLADLNHQIAERIATGLEQEMAPGGAAEESIGPLSAMLRGQLDFLEAPGPTVDAWTRGQPMLALAGDENSLPADGYLTTHDGDTYFAIISPVDPDDRLKTRRDLLGALRGHVEAVSGERPGFKVVFTGQAALVVEEMDSVARDTWRTAGVAVLGVTLLTLLVFRWRSHAVVVLVALAAGVIWAFGAVRIEYGYLNLITSSFISTLIGVGVAYGIHPVSEYELAGAHTVDPLEAVREAYRRTGPAVTVAGVTTSAAFFSILLMRFRGFAELGLVAGIGVLLCLAASLISLPALLVVYGRWRRRRDRAPRSGSKAALVDRLLVEPLAGRVCRAPWVVLLVTLLITVAAGWAAIGWLGFDTNILELLPEDAESVRYQRLMAMESDLSPMFNIVAAEDLETLRELERRARDEPTITRFESVLRLLPRDPTASRAAIERLRAPIEALQLPREAAPFSRERLIESLDRLEDALAQATDAAFGGGLADLAATLEDTRAVADDCRRAVREAPEPRDAEWAAGERRLLARAHEILNWLREAVRAEPPALETLPTTIRERLLTRSGKPLAFLFPDGDVFQPRELADYVQASRRVSESATGFPLVFQKMAGRIIGGFRRAVIAGGLLVLVILFIDFRNLRDATLAMIPLIIGMVWMIGAMRLFDISFNFANLVAVPLIIGVGIDNGVHVVQRVRLEGREGMHVVLRHTGRAILIASLTTMVGFGSLALASHRGMSSLGLVLLLGVGSCLITSTLVLPNLLVVLGIARK